METVLQDRMFLLIFGGRDATYQDDEQAFKNVYHARLAREIWVQYWKGGEGGENLPSKFSERCISKLKALVLLTTLDHYDLQSLLIENDDIDLRLCNEMTLKNGMSNAFSMTNAVSMKMAKITEDEEELDEQQPHAQDDTYEFPPKNQVRNIGVPSYREFIPASSPCNHMGPKDGGPRLDRDGSTSGSSGTSVVHESNEAMRRDSELSAFTDCASMISVSSEPGTLSRKSNASRMSTQTGARKVNVPGDSFAEEPVWDTTAEEPLLPIREDTCGESYPAASERRPSEHSKSSENSGSSFGMNAIRRAVRGIEPSYQQMASVPAWAEGE
jgi:hypothetical protein